MTCRGWFLKNPTTRKKSTYRKSPNFCNFFPFPCHFYMFSCYFHLISVDKFLQVSCVFSLLFCYFCRLN